MDGAEDMAATPVTCARPLSSLSLPGWLSPSPLINLTGNWKTGKIMWQVSWPGHAVSTDWGRCFLNVFPSRLPCNTLAAKPGWASQLPEWRAVEIGLQDSQATPLGLSLGLPLS